MTTLPQNILSIQSWVTYGHVGNAAAIFPLQRLGFEVWGIHTVQFSNHTGYGKWRGQIFDAPLVQELVEGIADQDKLSLCDAILSGYLGDASLGQAILAAVMRIKRLNPAAFYCCDPVMGDVGRGFFARPGIPEFFKENALPLADIITPNQFELEYLTGTQIYTLSDALQAAHRVLARGPKIVLLTSFKDIEMPSDTIGMLAVTKAAAFRTQTPLLPISVNGAGDTVAALFLAHFLRTQNPETALAQTTTAIFAILEQTYLSGEKEIQLVASQEAWVHPKNQFPAMRVS